MSQTVGLVVSDISNPFYAELCKTIQEELYHKGYNVFIVNTDEDKELEKVLMGELIQRSVDGMIIAPSNRIEALIPILRSTHIPVVFADRQGDENADFVGVDNFQEAKKLVYCFSKQPKKLAVVLKNNSWAITLEERVLGAKEACEELGVPFEIVQLPSEQNEVDSTIKGLIEEEFDSFLVLNNMVVLKILAGMRNNNIELGKDARLICFDDDEVFAFVNPPITALKQPISEIGIHAVERLFIRLKETHQPGKHNLRKCELMVRSSH